MLLWRQTQMEGASGSAAVATQTTILTTSNATREEREGSNHLAVCAIDLETATTAATLPAGAVGRSRGDVLIAADFHARTGEGAEGGLGTGARGLGGRTAGGTELDVKGSDADLLAADGNVLRGKHGSVRGRLVTIGLHLHAASHTRDSFAAGNLSNVDERVVEGRENVADAEHLREIVTTRGTKGKIYHVSENRKQPSH